MLWHIPSSFPLHQLDLHFGVMKQEGVSPLEVQPGVLGGHDLVLCEQLHQGSLHFNEGEALADAQPGAACEQRGNKSFLKGKTRNGIAHWFFVWQMLYLPNKCDEMSHLQMAYMCTAWCRLHSPWGTSQAWTSLALGRSLGHDGMRRSACPHACPSSPSGLVQSITINHKLEKGLSF